jgi:hypothetical protein
VKLLSFKAKSKVQTFGHEFSWSLDLDSHHVKLPKAKSQVQRKKEKHPTSFPIQNNPSNITVKILLVFLGFNGKESTASRP